MSSTEVEIAVPADNDLATRHSDLAVGLKQFVPRLCVAVTIFVLLLVMGELAAYVYLRRNQPPLPFADLPVPADYLHEIQDSVKHQYLPFVQFRRKPFHGRYISVDEQGVRTTLNSQCNDPANLQVWMFGDSVLWGTGVADADTIPSQLARLYNSSATSVCIKNFAEQGWVSTQELVELILRLKHDRPPDFVVFYDGTDEIVFTQAGVPRDIDQTYYRVRDLLENSQQETRPNFHFMERTNTVRALNLLSQQIHRRFSTISDHLPPARASSIAQALVENYQKNLQVVDALAQTYGFRPVYFWYPTSSMGKKPLTGEEQEVLRREIQRDPIRFQVKQAVYELCSRLQRPRFFYLGDALDDKSSFFYLDAVHLTPEGNRIMAGKIFQVLSKTPTKTLTKN